MLEIERKFLVISDDFKTEAVRRQRIAQGYLNSNPERTVRVRIKGESGFLTVKGKGNDTGTTRFEWETEVALHEAKALLQLCEEGIIDKVRYEVEAGAHVFEIDEFFGVNEGLVIAEIELRSEDEAFTKPAWLGKEVTNDQRYYNSWLSKNPYNMWKQDL